MPEKEPSRGARWFNVGLTREPERGAGEPESEESSIYREEMELLRRKARLWAEGKLPQKKDAFFGMRVPQLILDLYRRAPERVKLAARKAFEAVLISWFLGDTPQVAQPSNGAPMIFNINLAISESRAETKCDLRAIMDLVEELYRLRMGVPPKQRQLIEELRKRLTN